MRRKNGFEVEDSDMANVTEFWINYDDLFLEIQ
jgi:hypothetical protein